MGIYIQLGILIARLYFLTAPACVCSHYGELFHGRVTASGAIFDMNELTCAHPTLPLGSIILFYNPENGVWLRCRVTDRGPFAVNRNGYASYPLCAHPIRQFDLSRAAFDSLSGGDLDKGIIDLRYRIVGRDIQGLSYNLDLPDESASERERLQW